MYDSLFIPDSTEEFPANVNRDSLRIIPHAKAEPKMAEAKAGDRFQFLRMGYFCTDSRYSKPGKPVFNLTVGLKDSFKG